ncbi:MAG TPA: restriction endonuclease subunit S [Comamonas sp.]
MSFNPNSSLDLPELPTEWQWLQLSELVDSSRGICYGIVQPGKHDPLGIPMINTGDILDGHVADVINFKVSIDLSSKFKRSTLKGGEILVTLVGANFGRVAIAPESYSGYNCSRAVGVVPVNLNKINSKYLMFALRSPWCRHLMDTWANTTAQPTFNLKDLGNLPISLPPPDVQKVIADFLSSIEHRITLLRKTNTTLEAIAQALFKSWFVDFDPVHAKQQGRAPAGMDAQTASLFPDSFEESELGMVPKGWRVGKIADICSTISNGSTPSRSKAVFWENGSIPWFKTGELSDGFLINSSEFITHEALSGSSVKIFPKFAVLMAIYAAPTVGRLGILTEEATFNQACTGMVAKENIGPWFLFWTLFNGRDWFNSRANGAAQQNISKAIVAAYELAIPNQPALDAFNRVVSALHESILLNSEKFSTLSKLRDTLLPRLISGQLRLPEAQALVEEAVDA